MKGATCCNCRTEIPTALCPPCWVASLPSGPHWAPAAWHYSSASVSLGVGELAEWFAGVLPLLLDWNVLNYHSIKAVNYLRKEIDVMQSQLVSAENNSGITWEERVTKVGQRIPSQAAHQFYTAFSQECSHYFGVAKGACAYCGQAAPNGEIDMILPTGITHRRSGCTTLPIHHLQAAIENAAPACWACNFTKGVAESAGLSTYRSLGVTALVAQDWLALPARRIPLPVRPQVSLLKRRRPIEDWVMAARAARLLAYRFARPCRCITPELFVFTNAELRQVIFACGDCAAKLGLDNWPSARVIRTRHAMAALRSLRKYQRKPRTRKTNYDHEKVKAITRLLERPPGHEGNPCC